MAAVGHVAAEKVAAVAEIAAEFRNASAMVVTEYRGLSMKQLSQLRRSLGTDVNYTVAKNTLVTRAAADAGVEGLDDLFVGPTAIAFVSGEAVDAAKALRDFQRDNRALVVKGGKVNFRVDKQSNLHLVIGKASFDTTSLVENYGAVLDEILRAKPAAAKGRYVKKITVSTTMGPGIGVDPNRTRNLTAPDPA